MNPFEISGSRDFEGTHTCFAFFCAVLIFFWMLTICASMLVVMTKMMVLVKMTAVGEMMGEKGKVTPRGHYATP
jgi:hypothetical protein